MNYSTQASAISNIIGAPGTPRRVQALSEIYGGTDNADSWVFSCISLIAGTGASYEWSITTPGVGKQRQPVESPPPELIDLLGYPNPQITYFDFAEDVFTDMDLFGNSYWLMDRMNGLGQPAELLRLEPEYIQAVADMRDNLIGWVYTVGSVQIPYRLDEIVQFRTRNPMPRIGRFYGMGTVEALIRSVESDLAQTQHVVSFFTNGARISGVLTSAEPMTPEQFRNVQLQFQEEYGGAGNAYKMLIADGSSRYQPISQGPASLGIVDLRKLQKDELLSGFNVPEFLLGGAAQAGVYKMEEAQNVFYRGMLPRAMRFEQKLQRMLTARWKLGFDVATGVTEPMSIKVARSREMMGTGASLNQILENQSLPKITHPEADVPLLPGGITPWYAAAGMDPPTPPALPGGAQGDGTPTINESSGEQGPGNPSTNPTRQDQQAESLPDLDTKELEKSQGLKPPPLPDGYEKLTAIKAIRIRPAVMQTALDVQGEFLNTVTPQVRQAFVLFFTGQRNRVMDKLSEFKGYLRRSDSTRKQGRSVSELDIDQLWDRPTEDLALTTMYMRQIDTWGPRALALVSEITTPGLIWAAENEHVSEARQRLTRAIPRVNETTRSDLRQQIIVGLRRRYTTAQIANGVSQENYTGIMGIFDDAVAKRSEVIARTESGMMFSRAAIATYEAGGVKMVEVYDGTEFDAECAAANGQLWSLDEADSNPQEHPNCVRFFVPVSK
jgi:HK97 family phage portal protein